MRHVARPTLRLLALEVNVVKALHVAEFRRRVVAARRKLTPRCNYKFLNILDNTFLFNVTQDPMERANLKSREPQVDAQLVAAWHRWNAQMLPEVAESHRILTALPAPSSRTTSVRRPSQASPIWVRMIECRPAPRCAYRYLHSSDPIQTGAPARLSGTQRARALWGSRYVSRPNTHRRPAVWRADSAIATGHHRDTTAQVKN